MCPVKLKWNELKLFEAVRGKIREFVKQNFFPLPLKMLRWYISINNIILCHKGDFLNNKNV